MIHEVEVRVTCDKCDVEEIISPEFLFPDYSGEGGDYDTTDEAIEKELKAVDWKCEDGKHTCPDCGEQP